MKKHMTVVLIGIASLGGHLFAQLPGAWKSHDMQRARPPVVKPSPQSLPVPPPASAVVLFDGKDFSNWRAVEGAPPVWKLKDGYMEVVPGSGDIWSRDVFGDIQLHIEWMIPESEGAGQEDGNSGVFLMDRYEVQILNSFQSATYADGQGRRPLRPVSASSKCFSGPGELAVV